MFLLMQVRFIRDGFTLIFLRKSPPLFFSFFPHQNQFFSEIQIFDIKQMNKEIKFDLQLNTTFEKNGTNKKIIPKIP